VGQLTFQFVRLPDRPSTYEGDLLSADERCLVFTHTVNPAEPAYVRGEEIIGPGYRLVWFLFKDQPYDVGRFYRPDGTWAGYYVDMLEPVHWDGADPSTVRPLVDLFLDIWISPGGTYSVLDEDELAEAEAEQSISPVQSTLARSTVQRLISEIDGGTFPPQIAQDFRLAD
jgi:predicted RNA-binding protein associated with RNAse of E/G family